ncbi:MAG: transcription termination/antitermination protein NusA [Candidatus Kerfeldbacteria bacterium]|nr:transcription termination/antitermination protein NusA [Candidatus Kerfeldbacteria bacterium]
MPQSPLKQAIEEICAEKNIPYQSVIETIEAALAVAYRKDFGEKNQNIVTTFDPDEGTSRVFDLKTVVDDALYQVYLAEQKEREQAEAEERLDEYLEQKRAEEEAKRPVAGASAEAEEVKEERFDPRRHIALSEAKKQDSKYELGDEIKTELFPPAAYGRMAAQTAKQVIIQRIREAERDTVYKEFKGREGEMITAMVQRVEGRMVLIDLGHTTAIMPPPEQVEREHYRPGDRIKVYIVAVNMTPKGPEIVVSRTHPEIVRKLFTLEVPELQSEAVQIKGIAREAGLRTKIAVWSDQKNIDPVGSLVGQRGTRVQTVISELGGEKIDIIEWSNDPVKFITNALSPAKIISIKLREEDHSCVAEVKDDQLSLAIGKSGQNVRLAAKLTGWKIDLVGENGPTKVSTNAAESSDGATEKAADQPPPNPSLSKEGSESPPTPSLGTLGTGSSEGGAPTIADQGAEKAIVEEATAVDTGAVEPSTQPDPVDQTVSPSPEETMTKADEESAAIASSPTE